MQIYALLSKAKMVLIINKLWRYELLHTKECLLLWSKIAIFTLFICISCSKTSLHPSLIVAEDLLWKNPDSCLTYLSNIDTLHYSSREKMVRALWMEHAKMKVNYGLEEDSTIAKIRDYFEGKKDSRYAGEANYIFGRNLLIRGQQTLSTYYLKQAEEWLSQTKNVRSQLFGAVYYSLALCSEDERLFAIANEYHQQAIPYFIDSKDSTYISCCYRDMARALETDSSKQLAYIDSALAYIGHKQHIAYRLEEEVIKYLFIQKKDTPLVWSHYHVLCDSFQIKRHASHLINHYLAHNKLDSAYTYLHIFETDTMNSVWSKEHFLYQKAQYQAAIGLKDSAIQTLQALHNWQTTEIENSAYIRAYMVEKRYDVEREQRGKEKIESRRKQTMIWLILIAVTACFIISTILIISHQRQIRQQQEKQQQEERNSFLEKELALKRKHLQQQLQQRIYVSSQLKKHLFKKKELDEASLRALSSTIIFLNREQETQLVNEFEQTYPHFLTELRQSHPKLTDGDCLYIALIALGCSTEDISILLNVSNQTIWNRKGTLRQHLGISENVDDWLHKFFT